MKGRKQQVHRQLVNGKDRNVDR
jgi:hypothetical protein